jgi:hypothetical protein
MKVTMQLSAAVDVQEFLYDLERFEQSDRALFDLAEGIIEQVHINRPELVAQLVKRWSTIGKKR